MDIRDEEPATQRPNPTEDVHAILRRLPEVARFSFATPAFGGEGATFVHLHPAPESGPPSVPGGLR